MGFFDQIKTKINSKTMLIVILAAVGVGAVAYFSLSSGGGSSSYSLVTTINGVKTEKPVISILGEKGAVTAKCDFGKSTPKSPKCSFTVKNAVSGTVVKTTKIDSLTSTFYIASTKVRTGQFTISANISDGSKKVIKEALVSFNLKQEVSSSVVGLSRLDIIYKEEKLTDGLSILFNSSEAVTMDLEAIPYDINSKVSNDKIAYTWSINSLDGNTVIKTTPKDKTGKTVSVSITPKNKNSRKSNIRINVKVDNKGKQKTFITDFVATFSDFDTKLIYSFTNINIASFSGLKNSKNLKKDIDPMIGRIGGEIMSNPSIKKVFDEELKEVKRVGTAGIEKEILANEKKLVDLAVELQNKKKTSELSNDDIGTFFNLWLKIYAQIDYMSR